MKRLPILLLFLLLAAPVARAQTHQTQCPGSIQSWSAPLPAPMQFMTFDLTPPLNTPVGWVTSPGATGVPLGFLTVLYLTQKARTFISLPYSTAVEFPIAANPITFFAYNVASSYHELLLIEHSNCPLALQSTGALWTH